MEFDILATLRRSGEEVTPIRLYQTLMLSSGAMSVRLDKPLARGLIYRQPHEHDRRSCKVGLTDAGLALIDSAVADHVENEQRLPVPLDVAPAVNRIAAPVAAGERIAPEHRPQRAPH